MAKNDGTRTKRSALELLEGALDDAQVYVRKLRLEDRSFSHVDSDKLMSCKVRVVDALGLVQQLVQGLKATGYTPPPRELAVGNTVVFKEAHAESYPGFAGVKLTIHTLGESLTLEDPDGKMLFNVRKSHIKYVSA